MEKIFALIVGFISQIMVVKYLLIKTVRLDSIQLKYIYNLTKNKGFKFIINENFVNKDNETPIEYDGFFKIKNLPFFKFKFEERLLNAGWTAKDSVGYLTYFRWNNKTIKEILKNCIEPEDNRIGVYVMCGNNCNHLGHILSNNETININPVVSLLENDILRMIKGEIKKTSALLYGEPGNGKTTAIRDLAKKYGFNITFVSFNKDLKNVEILEGLSYVSDKTFVVFEDFDSVFNKRELLNFESANFTFDVILNSLDGIFNNYENVVFFMTANDIGKIDDSIKNRPSRMKHKILFKNPTLLDINNLLQNDEISKKCLGKNLDEIYMVKDMMLQYDNEYVLNNL